MKRALTFAKYLPAALCGLLLGAWAVRFFWSCNIVVNYPNTVEDGNCIGLRMTG